MRLLNIYKRLYRHFGSQGWWPAETRFEVIVGAILTQNTSWRNVEKAIEGLKREGVLSPKGLLTIQEERLQELLRPVGYFRVKARRLKQFIDFLFERYDGQLESLLHLPIDKLRRELLSVTGIGKETADSIILYAAEKPSFVVDAYTARVFSRMEILKKDAPYDETKEFFEENLPEDLEIYKEFHALVVRLGKTICKTKPLCGGCPLNDICAYEKPSPS